MQQITTFIFNHGLLSLALVIILGLLMMNMLRSKLLGFKELKPMEAVHIMNQEGTVVMDARNAEEYSQGHLVNAKNTPFDTLAEQLEKYHDLRPQNVILYCHNGQKSARAAALLKKNGFQSVYKLDGGIVAWQSANLPLEKDSNA